MQDVTPVKSNLAQMQSGHYSQSEARRWETETKEGQECQFESMTSQEPHVIWVLQSNYFETFSMINRVQFKKKIKSEFLFIVWDFYMIWSLGS